MLLLAEIGMQVVATAKPYGPGLADLIEILGAGGGAFGSFVGLVYPTAGSHAADEMARNAGLGLAIGGVIGTVAAFSIWGAIRLNGGVG
jgi:hypothetical protein